ncbi:MFS transporter [Thermus thermamylovorans]|uniref:MFS transporter n=1 Tax=Thermus thermamylovorans TaxID=2509362 RepID=A0A4V2IV88_9DEIN|nr:MFS transporter [Thermus thermamylovorans]TBH21345.1 MFS transporter [Thermus thermamylovorans]
MRPWRYASGQLGLTLVSESFGTYVAFFYLERLGLSAALYALGRTLYALWDAVNDPLFGHLSDRTRTPWGRRRPWLLWGLPLFLLAYLLAFGVPEWARSPQVLPYYFLLAVFLYEGAATLVWVNYGALFPEMFRSLAERARAAALRRGTELFGLLLGIALAPLLFARVDFLGMALLFAGLALLAFLLFLPGIREDPKAGSGLGLLPSFRLVLGNRAFLVVALVGLLFEFGRMVIQTGMAFYATYSLGLPEGATAFLFAAVFLVALPSVFLWGWLAGALGGKRAWRLAHLLMGLAALLLFLPQGLLPALLVGALVGVGFAGVRVTGEVVMAKVIDLDAERTGTRREGAYYSLVGLFGRASGALVGLSFALLGPLFGYVSGEDPGPNPGLAFRFLVAVIPGAAILLAYALAALFPDEVRA